MGSHQSNPSRRQFLATLAGTGGAMLLAPHQLRAAQANPPEPSTGDIDPRVAEIVSKTIAVDMHSHVHVPYVKNPADAKPDIDIDLAGEIKRSGFSAVCETYPVDQNWRKGQEGPGVYYQYNLGALAYEDRQLARNHMRRALTLKDLQTAHEQHQPIIVQSAEGAQFVEGHLERLEEAYKRGLRHLGLVHEMDDVVSPLGDEYTSPPHLGGLTPFGGEVIKECNRLGIVVDLAHGTPDVVMSALKVSTEPMLISHTGLFEEINDPDMRRRLVSKENALAVAAAGGVIGVWWRTAHSVPEYVASVRKMVEAVGIDHVGIGTDSYLIEANGRPGGTNKLWPDQNAGFFYAVAGEMLKQGFKPDEIGKIGGSNFCRVFGKVTAGHA